MSDITVQTGNFNLNENELALFSNLINVIKICKNKIDKTKLGQNKSDQNKIDQNKIDKNLIDQNWIVRG